MSTTPTNYPPTGAWAAPWELQPISTAPKDGTLILLANQEDDDPIYYEVGYWDTQGRPVWLTARKVYVIDLIHGEPTHWAPLPLLPAPATIIARGSGN